MDVAESHREEELGIAPGDSLNHVKESSSFNWLCVGHTHNEGIRPDPTSSNGGVANSGTWLDEKSTYLILKERPPPHRMEQR